MVWVNGKLVSQLLDTAGHGWEVKGNGKTTVRVERSFAGIEPGPAVPLLVSLWESNGNARYLERTVSIPGAPSPFVLPVVPSGQVIGPRIVREMFHCPPVDVDRDDLLPHIQGRLSHLSVGVFTSPGDVPSWDTFEKWLASWDFIRKPQIDRAKELGFRIIGIGDDFFRFPQHIAFMHSGTFEEQATRHVAAYLRDTGVCDGVEMVDEVGGDPAQYQPEEFIDWWRDEGGPSLAWPNMYPIQWETAALSDYSSRGWSSVEWAQGRPGRSLTLWQIHGGIKRAALDVPKSRPWSCNLTCTGPFYQKNVPGGEFQPGDTIIQGGCRASDIIAQAWLALAYGASSVRLYGYDWKHWRDYRGNWPTGVFNPSGLQTGTRPGDARWAGIEALASIEAHEAELVSGLPYEPVESGPWVIGRRGSLVWRVDTSESASTSPVEFGDVIGQDAVWRE